ncbi:MAG: ABC transporter substrate-binding protein [Desulfarculus sp.]|nr:MAG: ABC transporter substrate-binding protein [Desulfarculus sp.]
MKRHLLLLALSALLILGLAAPAPAGRPPIRIGYLQADIHQLACWVALDKGFYQAEGLKVQVAGIFRAGPEEMSAFAAGDLDMGYVGEAPATTAVANGAARVQVVAQVNTEGSAIVVQKASAAAGLAGLKGQRVAIPGHSTVQDFLLKKALSQAGLPLDAVQALVLKPPEMIGALRERQIAAFIAWQPYPAKAQTMGVGRVLMASGQIWRDHPCCVLVADERFLAARPDDVRAMLRAHVRATRFIAEHPHEALAIGVRYTGMDRATVRLAMAGVKYTFQISVAGEREYVAFLTKLGYIKLGDVQGFVDRFLNRRLLEEVLKR